MKREKLAHNHSRNVNGRGSLGEACVSQAPSPSSKRYLHFTMCSQDPSPTLVLPPLFTLLLWFSFLTLLIETMEETGKKARMPLTDQR